MHVLSTAGERGRGSLACANGREPRKLSTTPNFSNLPIRATRENRAANGRHPSAPSGIDQSWLCAKTYARLHNWCTRYQKRRESLRRQEKCRLGFVKRNKAFGRIGVEVHRTVQVAHSRQFPHRSCLAAAPGVPQAAGHHRLPASPARPLSPASGRARWPR